MAERRLEVGPAWRAHVVRVGAELRREVERDPLDGRGEREDRQRLAELRRSEAVDARAAGLDRAGGVGDALRAGPAAVEADERVLGAEREAGAVEELLDTEPLGEQVRSLADLQRALRRRPLVRADADELEPARGLFDARPGTVEDGRDGRGDGVEVAEV